MRGKVIRSFASAEPNMCASEGDVIEVPDDVDWVRAGFVEPLPDEAPPEIDLDGIELPDDVKKLANRLKKRVEDASRKTPEKAVTREKGKSAPGSTLKADSKKTVSRSRTSRSTKAKG